jgi:hypothetical protein
MALLGRIVGGLQILDQRRREVIFIRPTGSWVILQLEVRVFLNYG